VNGYEVSQPCNHSIYFPYFQVGFHVVWQVCSVSLESLHGRREESSSPNAREAWKGNGENPRAAKMSPEVGSELSRKAAKAR